jgi:creatinine amidohydrolase
MLEEMNAAEVRKQVNKRTVAVLILGACENHGDHMPFGSDFFVPMELARRLSKRLHNVLILPCVPFGVSLHHIDFQMTISLDPATMISLIKDILNSLVKNRITRILIINGHDGNISSIEAAARTIKNAYPNVTIACLESWWSLIGEIKEDLFEFWKGLGHGGEAETSAMLAIRPDLVDLDNASPELVPNLPQKVRIYWNFTELSRTGSTGAPKKATVKKGTKTLKKIEDVIISFINDMNRCDWRYGIQ